MPIEIKPGPPPSTPPPPGHLLHSAQILQLLSDGQRLMPSQEFQQIQQWSGDGQSMVPSSFGSQMQHYPTEGTNLTHQQGFEQQWFMEGLTVNVCEQRQAEGQNWMPPQGCQQMQTCAMDTQNMLPMDGSSPFEQQACVPQNLMQPHGSFQMQSQFMMPQEEPMQRGTYHCEQMPMPLNSCVPMDRPSDVCDAPPGKRQKLSHGEVPPVPGLVPGDEYTLTEVPESMIGLFIGKSGAFIKKLEADTGARVTVGKLVQSGFRRVCIVGSSAQQDSARERVEDFVTAISLKDSQRQTQEIVVAEMMIPDRMVGKVIGTSGAVIKSVTESSGVVYADMRKERDVNGERQLTIRGTQACVENFIQQIELVLLNAFRSIGVFNAPLEQKYSSNPAVQPFAAGASEGLLPLDLARAALEAPAEMRAMEVPGMVPMTAEAVASILAVAAENMSPGARTNHFEDEADEERRPLSGARLQAVLTPTWEEPDLLQEPLTLASVYASDEACVSFFQKFAAGSVAGGQSDVGFRAMAALGA